MSTTARAPEPPQAGKLASVISHNVRRLMDQRRVSQQELANAVGLPQSSISKRLRGAVPWDADDLEAVAIAFTVPVTELVLPQDGQEVVAPLVKVRRRTTVPYPLSARFPDREPVADPSDLQPISARNGLNDPRGCRTLAA